MPLYWSRTMFWRNANAIVAEAIVQIGFCHFVDSFKSWHIFQSMHHHPPTNFVHLFGPYIHTIVMHPHLLLQHSKIL